MRKVHKITNVKKVNKDKYSILNKDGTWNILCNPNLNSYYIVGSIHWKGVNCKKCLKLRFKGGERK